MKHLTPQLAYALLALIFFTSLRSVGKTTFQQKRQDVNLKNNRTVNNVIQDNIVFNCSRGLERLDFYYFTIEDQKYITTTQLNNYITEITIAKGPILQGFKTESCSQFKHQGGNFFCKQLQFAPKNIAITGVKNWNAYDANLIKDAEISNIQLATIDRNYKISFNGNIPLSSKLKYTVQCEQHDGTVINIPINLIHTNYYEATTEAFKKSAIAFYFIIEDKKGNLLYKKQLLNKQANTIAYPTQVKNLCTLQTTLEQAFCDVCDINGNYYFTKELNLGNNTLNLSAMQSGIILLRIRNNKNIVQTIKLIKEAS